MSRETIYKSLYIQARGILQKELLEHLRANPTTRCSHHVSMDGVGLGQINDIFSISERPASVEDRALPGHWEGDLLSGAGNSHIATLVGRQSRHVILAKVANKESATILPKALRPPVELKARSSFAAQGRRLRV